ncbi:hypothetical protein MYX04_03950 [Nitrospiraceae bacterium AH_259_D15_M11_P09]|nr:hypothetical protein [Nitrospiraceae bacterium AH_259_D15_M11_P09]
MAEGRMGAARTSSRSPHPPVLIRIADLTIALTSEDPALTLPNEGAITQFLVSDAEPDVRVRAAWGELDELSGEKLFDAGGLWQLYAAKDSRRFHFTSPALGPVPYKMASFDPEFTSGEVRLNRPYFPNGQTVYPLEYPLDELLILQLLAQGRGVEVHACGVVNPTGQGYLFAGQSGAGKTTIARLWQKVEGVTVLSDDRIILRNKDGRLWMYGTPWHGEAGLSCSARAPLAGVYLLRHGSSTELIPQRHAEAVARLVACSFPPFYSSSGLDFMLSLFDQVVNTVPCQELRFVPDERALALVRSS